MFHKFYLNHVCVCEPYALKQIKFLPENYKIKRNANDLKPKPLKRQIQRKGKCYV